MQKPSPSFPAYIPSLIGQNCHLPIPSTGKGNGVTIMGVVKHWTVRRRILLTERRGGMTNEYLGNQQRLLTTTLIWVEFLLFLP